MQLNRGIELLNDAIKYGANVIGGCCGSSPEHIKSIYNKFFF